VRLFGRENENNLANGIGDVKLETNHFQAVRMVESLDGFSFQKLFQFIEVLDRRVRWLRKR
jgi:hypothetical protein